MEYLNTFRQEYTPQTEEGSTELTPNRNTLTSRLGTMGTTVAKGLAGLTVAALALTPSTTVAQNMQDQNTLYDEQQTSQVYDSETNLPKWAEPSQDYGPDQMPNFEEETYSNSNHNGPSDVPVDNPWALGSMVLLGAAYGGRKLLEE